MADSGINLHAKSHLLKVYETVLLFGPISLDEVFPIIGRSRSSTFRCLKQLEAAGWIRTLINKHHFVATAFMDELVSKGAVSMPEVDLISLPAREAALAHKMHTDIGMLISNSHFLLAESTDRAKKANTPMLPLQGNCALVAYCIKERLDPERAARRVEAVHRDTPQEFITQAVGNCCRALQEKAYFICPDEMSSTIGLTFPSGQIGAVSISPRKIGAANVGALEKCSLRLVDALKGCGVAIGPAV